MACIPPPHTGLPLTYHTGLFSRNPTQTEELLVSRPHGDPQMNQLSKFSSLRINRSRYLFCQAFSALNQSRWPCLEKIKITIRDYSPKWTALRRAFSSKMISIIRGLNRLRLCQFWSAVSCRSNCGSFFSL